MMALKSLSTLRVLAAATLMAGCISLAHGQVVPNPPVLTVEGGSTVDPGNPGRPILFDDFNYVVGRTDSAASKRAAFMAKGWAGYKDEVSNPNGAAGYLYTTTSIPGYSGRMPGVSGSGRVLAMEGLPTSLGVPHNNLNQTDFYLSYGREGTVGQYNNVPGNVWFQFWVFINNTGSQTSNWSSRNKWIYPSDDGHASGSGAENAWLLSIRPNSQEGPVQTGPRAYIVNKIEAGSGGTTTSDSPLGGGYIGANLAPSAYTESGRWELYKVHIDHASVNGRYEIWKRTLGTQTWQKTTEWISGVTPGFTWITQPALRGGHNMFKIPTTWGTADFGDLSTNYDAWVYLADFAMAAREADLPTYSGY